MFGGRVPSGDALEKKFLLLTPVPIDIYLFFSFNFLDQLMTDITTSDVDLAIGAPPPSETHRAFGKVGQGRLPKFSRKCSPIIPPSKVYFQVLTSWAVSLQQLAK